MNTYNTFMYRCLLCSAVDPHASFLSCPSGFHTGAFCHGPGDYRCLSTRVLQSGGIFYCKCVFYLNWGRKVMGQRLITTYKII